MTGNMAILLTGKPDLPKPAVELRAGHLTAQYDHGAIRYIKSGRVEILRMIYSAVRDHNWETIQPVIRDETIVKTADSFDIYYIADYQHGDISYKAEYTIAGTPAGHIHFAMHGTALSSFRKNRVGFCILHPVKECAGNSCIIQHADGSNTSAEFPQHISPHQPFKNIQSMRWWPDTDINAELFFTGDIFETEDQRNWLDASYKTYCTPLALPFPAEVEKGQIIDQSAELKVIGRANSVADQVLKFNVSDTRLALPKIGLGASSTKKPLQESEIALLRELAVHHYRIDIFLADSNCEKELARELASAKMLNLKIEAVLHITAANPATLSACIEQLQNAASDVVAIVLLDTTKNSTGSAFLEHFVPEFRTAFPGVPIGSGTDCFFTELNRERTPTDLLDFLTFSINPQVHAFDNQSLIETLQTHREVVESGQQFAKGRAIHVSPVTLKMRFNPDATGPEPQAEVGKLPTAVDARQMSLFGAAWTLGSIKHLAESGTELVTYFETVGMRGVIQGEQNSPLPDQFAATGGQVFPIWQILKWVQEFKDGMVTVIKSPQPLVVDALQLEQKGNKRLIVVNYTLQPQLVALDQITGKITVLDENSVSPFSRNQQTLQGGPFCDNRIELLPYAIVCLDY